MALIIFSLTLFLMMLSLIFVPKIYLFKTHFNTHWMIVLFGALMMLLFNQVSLNEVFNLMFSDQAMNPIKLITLFIFLTVISLFLDEIGFFKWFAYKFINKSSGKQWKVFISIYVLTSILTVFTSNDIIILTLTPLIIYFSKNVKINPLPYLFGVLTAANTWSIMLVIGNPTNIYLASALGVDFMTYLGVMWLPGLVAGVSGFLMISFIFKKQLSKEIGTVEGSVVLKEPLLVILGIIHLFLCIVLMAISNYIQLEMWLITVVIAVSITVMGTLYLVIKKLPLSPIILTYQKAPWSFIPMILGMFILIIGITNQGVTQSIGEFLNLFDPIYGYGVSAHIISNLTNNQPMSMLYAQILSNQTVNLQLYQRMYASIIGSNTGVLLTPFGALAGLMWFEMLKKFKVDLDFLKYIKVMLPTGLIVLGLTLLTLSFMI